MADYALDQTLDMEDLRFDYRRGLLSVEDAYDLGIVDELGYEDRTPMFQPAPTTMTCKWCGESNLSWKQVETGWRLADSKGSVHSCTKYKKLTLKGNE